MSEISLESLIAKHKCSCAQRWYPTSVDTYKGSFEIDKDIPQSFALLSNLAYSMQYIEFLEKEFTELTVSSVIYTMLVKTYVITGMSVLEGLFSNIIKSHHWWKMSTLESLGSTQSNEAHLLDERVIIKTELQKRVDPYPLSMNLDDLIKILNRHHDALQVDHLVYPALGRLRELRNRVHLQKADDNFDNDYKAFDFSVKKEMGGILYLILTSPMVTKFPNTFDFLKINIKDTYTHS